MEKDKWSYEYFGQTAKYLIYKNEKLVCSAANVEDARRIVACVNACAGIDTETLELGFIQKMKEALEAQEQIK